MVSIDNDEVKAIKDDTKNNMMKTVDVFVSDISGIRTGRANPSLLDGISVNDGYGGHVKLSHIASVSVIGDKTLSIKSWDVNNVKFIKESILNSQLGLTPIVEDGGSTIRLVLPDLTKEMRNNLVKSLNKLSEEAKVSIRNIRRGTMDELKQLKNDKKITEDEFHSISDDIQVMTDSSIKTIDENFLRKKNEILNI